MNKTQRIAAIGRLACLTCILSILVGCGEEAASLDPAARAQTEADAKNAMATQSNKRSGGQTPQQNTRNAMEAGSRQQKQNKSH
jgi:hypothetical protein